VKAKSRAPQHRPSTARLRGVRELGSVEGADRDGGVALRPRLRSRHPAGKPRPLLVGATAEGHALERTEGTSCKNRRRPLCPRSLAVDAAVGEIERPRAEPVGLSAAAVATAGLEGLSAQRALAGRRSAVTNRRARAVSV
jgi:hypothetical protein